MSITKRSVQQSHLALLVVLCLAALTATSVYAQGLPRPTAATDLIGSPDAAVNGKFAVGSASVGTKALTVTGVIDFLGAGTVHNYFTQGGGNNMQINTNVDEANAVGDASRSQWKLVLGSSQDWFSIRRSPAGGTYNEDALFFIDGATGRIGIATVDTGNGVAIPFTPQARLHVETDSGSAVYGITSAATGVNIGVYGQTQSTSGYGVYGYASNTTGTTYGLYGNSFSTSGRGVAGYASATTGTNYGVYGQSLSTQGYGVYGLISSSSGNGYGVWGESNATGGGGVAGIADATTGANYGVYGQTNSPSGYGVYGFGSPTIGVSYGVYGRSDASAGRGVYGYATATDALAGNYGVIGISEGPSGTGVRGIAHATSGHNIGMYGESDSPDGTGVRGDAAASSGTNYGVLGQTGSPNGYAVYGHALANTGTNYGVYGRTNSSSGYGVYYVGGLAGTGTKSAIIDTQDYGWRSLYAMESPQNWFEDFGQATLTTGEAVVKIEPIFAQTVNLSLPYHVFLTPTGSGCTLYIADKSSTSFTVRANEGADCAISFDYRIIAPRRDYEDLRLKPAADPQAVAASMAEPPSAPQGQQAP
jgi:hypothetical protein